MARSALMSRAPSSAAMMAPRTMCMKPAPHCAPKPAPPAPSSLVIHSLSCMYSAMVIFHSCLARISRLSHRSRSHPSGRSEPGSLFLPHTLRIQPVASNRSRTGGARANPARYRGCIGGPHHAHNLVGSSLPTACSRASRLEINPTPIADAPPVESPNIKVVGTEMVVDNVVYHRDAVLMRCIDQTAESIRAAIALFD